MEQLEGHGATYTVAKHAQCVRACRRCRCLLNAGRRQALHPRGLIYVTLEGGNTQRSLKRMALALLKQHRHSLPRLPRRGQLRFQVGLILPAKVQRAAEPGKGSARHGQNVALSIHQLRFIGQAKRTGFAMAEIVQCSGQQAVLQRALANTWRCFRAGTGITLDDVYFQHGLAHIL
ncbi:hypothetical protein D3C76_889890 [compost metagenome]